MINERFDDVAFLKNPNGWPCWPICPVRRSRNSGGPESGLVFTNTTEVVMLNMFSGWTVEEFKAAERYSYESIEDLIIDGWRVD